MAGYMSKLTNYVFEGECTNGTGAATTPGHVYVRDAVNKKFVLPTADSASQFTCIEAGVIYGESAANTGMTAYRFVVDKLAANYYFHEQTEIPFRFVEFDMTTYAFPVGERLRCHPLQVGDEFWTTEVTGTPVVGTAYGVTATGTIG